MFLQGFFPEYCVAVSLKHVGLLAGPLRDVLHQTTEVKCLINTKGLTTQRCRLLTFIHCSAWGTASK
jgi:hypothetical protein